MTQEELYTREVSLACEREREDNHCGWSYGCSCYESALKAFKSLCNDGHSGYSFSVTKNILIRMCDGLPLSPIIEDDFKDENGGYLWQCPRMGSLFREVESDGNITYSDVDRYYAFENGDSKHTFTGGGIAKILDEMFPITLPYYPSIEKYKVCVETSLLNPRNGDFDTRAVLWVQTPIGERIDINRFYTEIDGRMTEISKSRYEELIKSCKQ